MLILLLFSLIYCWRRGFGWSVACILCWFKLRGIREKPHRPRGAWSSNAVRLITPFATFDNKPSSTAPLMLITWHIMLCLTKLMFHIFIYIYISMYWATYTIYYKEILQILTATNWCIVHNFRSTKKQNILPLQTVSGKRKSVSTTWPSSIKQYEMSFTAGS